MAAFLIRMETVTVTYAVIEANTEEEAKAEMEDLDHSRAIRDLSSHQKAPLLTCCDSRDNATPFVTERVCRTKIGQEINT